MSTYSLRKCARILKRRSPFVGEVPGAECGWKISAPEEGGPGVGGLLGGGRGRLSTAQARLGARCQGRGKDEVCTGSQGLTHRQEVCPSVCCSHSIVQLDLRNVIFTLPVEAVVEGREVRRHAGGEIPQIHAFAQGAIAQVETPVSFSL